MSTDKEHLSLPTLYGAPAHRPRRMAALEGPPAMGPDDLPLEYDRLPEEQSLALQLFPRSYGGQVIEAGARPIQSMTTSSAGPILHGTPLLLRALSGVLMRPKDH